MDLTYLLLTNLHHLCLLAHNHGLGPPITVDLSLFRTLMLLLVVISSTSTTLPLAGALYVLQADATTCGSALLGFLLLLATPFAG